MIVPTSVPKMKKPQNDRASEYCPRHSVQYHAVFAAIGISSAGNRGALSAATEAASPAETSAGSSAGKAAIREMDSNFQYASTVRWHRATDFADSSHREAALRGAPASHNETAFRGAAGFRETRRRHVVHTCEMRSSAAVQAARYRAARRAAMRSAHCEIRRAKT
jgi:hypothetical protein